MIHASPSQYRIHRQVPTLPPRQTQRLHRQTQHYHPFFGGGHKLNVVWFMSNDICVATYLFNLTYFYQLIFFYRFFPTPP